MESDLRSIGEMARACGLGVSALRFYDRVGVLVPALVDPATGYRWYAEHQLRPARLVAALRRVGMPLPEIATAVRDQADPAMVRRLLDGHLRRLEDGLADARRELSRIHALLDSEEHPMTVTQLTVSRAELAAAIEAVRFAVGDDPDLPMLAGVLFDVEPGTVRLVATDRYRLAVGTAVATVAGPTVQALAPVDFVDQARALLAGGSGVPSEVRLTLDPAGISLAVDGRTVTTAALTHDFPDYRRLLHKQVAALPAHRVPVDVPALRAALTGAAAPVVVREHDGVRTEVAVLGVDDRGELILVGGEEPATGEAVRVGVNREFLLDALDAGGRGQLVLELDGPIAPLAVRLPDDERSFSILMPIRL